MATSSLWNRLPALILLAVMLLAACVPPRTRGEAKDGNQPTQIAESTAAETGPITDSATPEIPISPLKPPDAELPAAGICSDPPDGEVVTMTIRPDVPDPRCARANPDHMLKLVNGTDAIIQVTLGIVEATIPAGGEHIIETPLGEYLDLGVHFVQVTPPGMGGELWLVED